MKGIILAGGNGTRLHPLTIVTNKHLIPVYNKPMIFYPIETFVKAGIKDLLIVTSAEFLKDFYKLLNTGRQWGINIRYEIQESSNGTGGAIMCAKDFVNGDDFMVILGDNIVSGDLKNFVDKFTYEREFFKSKILITKSENPKEYGVVNFVDNIVTDFEEKPEYPKSDYVATGIWVFTSEVFDLLAEVKKSKRGEYEITDVFKKYITSGTLKCNILEDDWTDAGTFEQLFRATKLVREREEKLADEDMLIQSNAR